MTPEETNAVVLLLVNDALEATQEHHAKATMLLIDAALSILVTRHKGEAAEEMGGMIACYVMNIVAKAEALR